MLQIKHLTIRHKKDYRVLLEDFNFSMNQGDKCALIGEEGNGKSTLLKLIYAPEMVEKYVEYEGEILRTGERFGYLPQELSEDGQECSIYEYFTKQEGFLDKAPGELAKLCSKIGFPAERIYSDESFKALSGGEKIKAQMIGLLIGEPTLLLLDEPSNNLDIGALIWLEHFIKDSDIPALYISHDETLLEHTANRIIHIEQLKRKTVPRCTVVRLGYGEYIAERGMKFEKQEQMAKNERREYDRQQEKFRRIRQKVEHQQNAISRQNPHGGRLLKKSMHRVKAYEARFEKEFENMTERPEYEEAMFARFGSNASMPKGKVVLDFNLDELCILKSENAQEVIVSRVQAADANIQETAAASAVMIANHNTKEVSREKEGIRHILARNIRLFVKGPEHICIIGKNGCGKTTLMHLLAEELLQRTDIKAAYMPQNYEELLDLEQSASDFLSDGSKESSSMMRTYLGSMKFTPDEMMHPMRELSGGQKAKVIFLHLCASGCNVLLLDEPSRNFSPLSNPVIRQILADYKGAIISISHDRKYIAEVCSKVYELTESGLREVADPFNDII